MRILTTKMLAVSAGVLMLSSCSMKNIDMNHAYAAIGAATQALTLSDEEIAQYAQQSIAQLDSKAQIAPANNKYSQRLAKLTNGLTSVDGTPLNFKVYLTKEINAFACPDGSVRVYSGIMDMMDDDELLGIIGHEIGHVAMKHSKNAMKQALLNGALREAIASTSATAAQLTQGQLSQLTEAYLSSSFSRKQENEADDFGYEFLKGAKKNPWAMVKAFEKMQVLEQQAAANNGAALGTYLNNMFSDHPATAERIERMTKRCNKDGIARPK